jgi:hypothetical protein
MSSEKLLREKLRKIEAVLARPGTQGERQAAEEARDRVRTKLAELQPDAPSAEFQISVPDLYSCALFFWLCRKYRVNLYRYPRQRQTTIVFRTSARIHGMLSLEFAELEAELLARLKKVANKFILERVSANNGDGA